MSFKDMLLQRFVRTYTSETYLMRKRSWAELRRRLSGQPHRVMFYFRVDDPYACLLAQVLPKLAQRFAVEIQLKIGAPPTEARVGDLNLWQKFAQMDAAVLARAHGLSFPQVVPENLLDPESYHRKFDPAAPLLPQAMDLAARYWAGEAPDGPDQSSADRLREDAAKRGHYLNGMLYYGGEWYWGLDRLSYLYERLAQLGLGEHGDDLPFVASFQPTAEDTKHRPEALEVFYSFRSPYSYLSLDRLATLCRRKQIQLKMRPVMPMVTRGVALPRAKKFYIIGDSARIGRREGVPFGHIVDPLGKGVAHCFDVFMVAASKGREFEWALSVGRGIWSEGRDPADLKELETMVTRAGLHWADVQPQLGKDGGRDMAQANRDTLNSLGLWGVPCFRYGSFTTWGQDRIPLIERLIPPAKPTPETK